jgi:hypothetical protein
MTAIIHKGVKKGFKKVRLTPNRTERIEFILPARNLAYFDEKKPGWTVEPARYQIYVGPSSRRSDLLETGFQILK